MGPLREIIDCEVIVLAIRLDKAWFLMLLTKVTLFKPFEGSELLSLLGCKSGCRRRNSLGGIEFLLLMGLKYRANEHTSLTIAKRHHTLSSRGAVVSTITIANGFTAPFPFFPLQDRIKVYTSSSNFIQLLSSSRSLGTGFADLGLYEGMYPIPDRCVTLTSMRCAILTKTRENGVLDVIPSTSREACR